jgi:hypothetical protein
LEADGQSRSLVYVSEPCSSSLLAAKPGYTPYKLAAAALWIFVFYEIKPVFENNERIKKYNTEPEWNNLIFRACDYVE